MFLFKRKNKEHHLRLITFSTCYYILKSKFDDITYLSWIKNIISITTNFNLVIYTNDESYTYLSTLIKHSTNNIKLIIKNFEDFYTYKYKDNWIKNHEQSNLDLHAHTDWKLNMLWNEKVFFVNQTIANKYFNTQYYGWCDIGYFRNRNNDTPTKFLQKWPNAETLMNLPFNNNCIHYGCIQNDNLTYVLLSNEIKKHYLTKSSSQPLIHNNANCFAGGFFILKPNMIDNYTKLYNEKLVYYFANNFIIKDDQTIIMDIIFCNQHLFYIHTEANPYMDNWFMFQRLLL